MTLNSLLQMKSFLRLQQILYVRLNVTNSISEIPIHLNIISHQWLLTELHLDLLVMLPMLFHVRLLKLLTGPTWRCVKLVPRYGQLEPENPLITFKIQLKFVSVLQWKFISSKFNVSSHHLCTNMIIFLPIHISLNWWSTQNLVF